MLLNLSVINKKQLKQTLISINFIKKFLLTEQKFNLKQMSIDTTNKMSFIKNIDVKNYIIVRLSF